MSEYYTTVYQKRLNRFGLDYQSRIQGQRERDFENYLLKSIYRVDFWYNDIYVPASLEHNKQDETETISYLLTRRELNIPNGTVLQIENADGRKTPWMVWWLEEIATSGYNRYTVLKMNQRISWRDANGNLQEQWGYFEGPGASKIKDVIKSKSGKAIYSENNNLHLFITPYSKYIERDLYFELSYEDSVKSYTVTETDILSTPGVEYVSLDPSFIRNKDEKPVQQPDDDSAEFYWLNGGN